jgi:YD repeat-containing protein
MKKIVLAAMSISLLFTACKKETSEQVPGGIAGKTLKKITKTEGGTVTIYNIGYDASKRLASINSADNKESTVFTYDGNNNVVKVEQSDADTKNLYTYTYSSGVPVSGSFKSWQVQQGQPDELQEEDALTYTVTNNQVTKIRIENPQLGQIDFVLTYTNGNVTRIESEGINFYTATFTYGNKKPVFPQVFKYVLDQAGFSLQFFAKNELLSESYQFGTVGGTTETMQYTYDADGNVLTSTDGTTQLKYEYQ